MAVMHQALDRIKFLKGIWISTQANGEFPTIKPFQYEEELTFESHGQPMFNYTSKTFNLETKKPMHFESGFLRINGENLAFMVAHNFGLTSLEEGKISRSEIGQEINLKSINIARMNFAKEPAVKSISRKIIYHQENDSLEIFVNMATSNVAEEKPHLHIIYKRKTV